MDKDTLNNILKQHAVWLQDKDGIRANLQNVDLQGANLKGVDLRTANLQGANLQGADLSFADLQGADLRGANLINTNLIYTNLNYADLEGANLQGANLSFADIINTNLMCVDIQCVNRVSYIPMSCPDEGSFVAWKKAFSSYGDPYLVKLLIPEDARRSSATGRKCRADKAKVLSIEPLVTTLIVPEVYSKYDKSFAYKVGQTVVVPDFDTDRFNECSTGIHFFINRQEAIDFLL